MHIDPSNNHLLAYQIALTKIAGVGDKTGKTLVAYCGGVEHIWTKTKEELSEIPSIGMTTVNAILGMDPIEETREDIHYLKKNKINTAFYLSNDYPQRLKHYDDAPTLLYYKGDPLWDHARTVGIVGTRSPTENGKELCQKLVEELQTYGVIVISGLAYGIDTMAHKSAINIGMPNIAVMGTGIDKIYPSQNGRIARNILKNGMLITECKIGADPDRENFPKRNRIIAALSDALVVVESASKGGSLITAQLANGYHKDVFAFPGRVTDTYSAGCNKIIKEHRGNLLESASDIAYIMGWDKKESQSLQTELFVQLSDLESQVVSLFSEAKELRFDAIHAQAKMTMSQLSSTLLSLEFKGMITSLPGKTYRFR